MCKRYVNTTVALFSDISFNDEGVPRNFVGFFDTVNRQEDSDGKVRLPSFYILTRFNFLGTQNVTPSAPNPIKNKTCFDVVIRLTKCSRDNTEQQFMNLDRFKIDIAEEKVCKACFEYLNTTHITPVKDLVLDPGVGKYVLKVLIRDEEEERKNEKYSIQSMYPLYIGNPDVYSYSNI